ncbi:MAG: hypothetical protein IJW92_05640 [Clostridia bacterium]|nr:hypothetical protein [Clostridia bacterium]
MKHEATGAEAISLQEDHVYFGGMNLTYRLLMTTGARIHRFRIRVVKDGEFGEGDAGCDLFRAMGYYQRIVEGTVTPCTLEAVLHDLQYA